MTATRLESNTQLALEPEGRSISWRLKSAGHITAWVGGAFCLFLTAFIAATGPGSDATRWNMPGVLIAGGFLAVTGGLFTGAWLTKDDDDINLAS